jgi:hypothetical protein
VKEEVEQEVGEGKREELGKEVEWELVRNSKRVRVRDSKCMFRFFVEHFYYVCNRNIIPVTTSKILAQNSCCHNFNCK